MLDRANEVRVLKLRIHELELRRERLKGTSGSDDSFWVSSDVERMDSQIREAKAELAKIEGRK
jgi:hypothetical protein